MLGASDALQGGPNAAAPSLPCRWLPSSELVASLAAVWCVNFTEEERPTPLASQGAWQEQVGLLLTTR